MRFVDWVRSEGWSWSRAAVEIGVANSTVARRFAQGTVPRKATMQRIYLRSGGRVTPNDFYELPAPAAAAAANEAEPGRAA
jgi:hypothetical protein